MLLWDLPYIVGMLELARFVIIKFKSQVEIIGREITCLNLWFDSLSGVKKWYHHKLFGVQKKTGNM